jgi:hypothetical protein
MRPILARFPFNGLFAFHTIASFRFVGCSNISTV